MNLESQDKSIDPATGKLVVFEDKQIRRVFHDGEWYFSIIDIVEVLTESRNPRRYWSDLKIQMTEKEGFDQLYGKIVQLKFESSDGKKYRTDAANTETLLRIQSSQLSEPARYTKPKGTLMTGLKNGCAALPFEKNELLNGKKEGLSKRGIMPFLFSYHF